MFPIRIHSKLSDLLGKYIELPFHCSKPLSCYGEALRDVFLYSYTLPQAEPLLGGETGAFVAEFFLINPLKMRAWMDFFLGNIGRSLV